MTPSPTVVFRARSGQGITIGVAVLSAGALLVTAVQDPASALRFAPALLLPAAVVWLVLGRPAVVVDDAGVSVRNVLRTIELPWPSIERIDTKYALTLYTGWGVYSAWAAPAPGRMSTMGASPQDIAHLPESSYIGGGVRPGDVITSPSGEAAAYIRRRWQELHDAGHLDRPRLERDRPRVRWHVLPTAAVVAVGVLAVLLLR